MTTLHRFVPPQASLTDDAPGWGDIGPICWKCRGVGCKVCHQRGRIASKRIDCTQPGKITRGRFKSNAGPVPPVEESHMKLLERSNQGEDVIIEPDPSHPAWMPQQGEELCCLVGHWRILQRVGSHRWTTDDLVTAWVASQYLQEHTKYLDLGTGNASVLQMVTWSALYQNRTICSLGIEARSEAVALARRSLQFNLGLDQQVATIQHGDFRSLHTTDRFHLVTGTPPYFAVDFEASSTSVASATIRQGGMPTAKQSAPARCEFRGGIEAYCEAAARLLVEEGRFAVCENYQNHERVLRAAQFSGLGIERQVQVEGKQGRGILFVVYVMVLGNNASMNVEHLCVRDGNSCWTQQYKDSVLSSMCIPT